MNQLIFIFGSGWAFFSAVLLLIVVPFAAQGSSRIAKRLGNICFLLGILIIALSSAPVPNWMWVAFGLGCIGYLASTFQVKLKVLANIFYFAGIFLLAFQELHWSQLPRLEHSDQRTMVVVGDSVTAGTGASDKTTKWPALIEQKREIQIDDRSVPGAKCSTALKQLQSKPIHSPNIFLEIGGNDLLGSTSNEKFEQDLENLLRYTSRPGRQVIMFELPLPPLRNRFGQIQRRLARKYYVRLIPKRFFVSVLTHKDSTIDSVHLTQLGHQRMAQTVWQIIEPIFTRKGR